MNWENSRVDRKMKVLKVLLVSIGCLVAVASQAQQAGAVGEPKRYAHFSIGEHKLDDAWTLKDEEGTDYLGDIEKLRSLAFTLQTPLNHGVFQYGWEGAGSIAYERNVTVFLYVNGGATGTISVDSDLWTGDFSAGGFVSLEPTSWLRFYASAGPQIFWGLVDSKDDEVSIDSYPQTGARGSSIVINTSSSDSDLGVGIYARAGVDLILPNGFILGGSIKQTNTELNFSGHGSVDLTEPFYQLTLGHKF